MHALIQTHTQDDIVENIFSNVSLVEWPISAVPECGFSYVIKNKTKTKSDTK